MKEFYQPSLDKVEAVLASQLERARRAGHTVEKIILTGGFGQSPSLQSHLKQFLDGRTNIKGRQMEMIVPKNPSVTYSPVLDSKSSMTESFTGPPQSRGEQFSERSTRGLDPAEFLSVATGF